MPREAMSDVQPRMDGGLNTVSDELSLLDTQLRVATNARLTDFGALTKRGGTQRASSAVLAAASVLNGFAWRQDSGSQQLMAVANATLYTSSYGSLPWTWTAQTGTLSTTVAPSFAQFRDGTNDVVYIADGGLLNVWNGTTFTTNIASTAQCSAITVHNQRLWGTGVSTAPDSIFYSSLNNGSTLGIGASGGGQIIVRTFGDETIVGLASVGASLLIFHRQGISRLTGFGQDDITVAPQGVTADVGTIAAKAIVPVGNVCYFISERGLFRCNEGEVAPVGTPEKPDPLLPEIRSLSSAQFDSIRAVFNRGTRELWISVPTIGVYVYHTLLQAWTGPWDTGYISPATSAMWEALNANGLPVILKGDTSGWVSLCDAPSITEDNVPAAGGSGTRYALTAQMHRMYCKDDTVAKALRWGYVTAQLKGSDQCTVSWQTDTDSGSYTLPGSTYGIWGTGTWGTGSWATTTSQNYRIPMGGNGYYVDLSIVDSGAALPVFSRVALQTFLLGRR